MKLNDEEKEIWNGACEGKIDVPLTEKLKYINERSTSHIIIWCSIEIHWFDPEYWTTTKFIYNFAEGKRNNANNTCQHKWTDLVRVWT